MKTFVWRTFPELLGATFAGVLGTAGIVIPAAANLGRHRHDVRPDGILIGKCRRADPLSSLVVESPRRIVVGESQRAGFAFRKTAHDKPPSVCC
jgi:hypothetical protein